MSPATTHAGHPSQPSRDSQDSPAVPSAAPAPEMNRGISRGPMPGHLASYLASRLASHIVSGPSVRAGWTGADRMRSAHLALLGAGRPPLVCADDLMTRHGAYRLALAYWWDLELPPLLVIGQNPSTADRYRSDPTATRCARRAFGLGYGGVVMLNLFAFVTPYPRDLWASLERPEAEEMTRANNLVLWLVALSYPKAGILFAPGADSNSEHRARAAAAETLMRGLGRDLLCLGTTKEGLPRHPSRCGYAVEVEPWTGSYARPECRA